MSNKEDRRKLISFTEDGEPFLKEIKKIAKETGLTESIILENSYCLGLVLLYSPERVTELKEMLKKRFKAISGEKSERIISLLTEMEDKEWRSL